MSDFRMPIMDRSSKSPMSFVWEPTPAHRAQALNNHGQTLERLRERGGLCWSEMEGVLNGIGWGQLRRDQAAARDICITAFPQPVISE